MASPHRIITAGGGTLNFEFWEGDPPPIIHEQVASFTKAGADGTGQQKLGKHHRPIEALLTSIWPNYTQAIQALATYKNFPASGLHNVIYNNVNWSGIGILFYVDAVEFISCQARPLWLGPDFNYPGGADLVTRWTLQPIEVI